MEYLIFIVVIVVLVVVLNLKSDLVNRIHVLETRLEILLGELKKLKNQSSIQTEVKEKPEERVIPAKAPIITPLPVIEETYEPTIKEVPIKEPEVITIKETITPPTVRAAKPKLVAPEPKKPGFFERNPDLEKFIGENLANKIGIGVLVLGIGFFVKFAIDQNWIGVIGRVFIGILCGGILLGIAHKLRKSFVAFSSVLVGGGIAILYLTIAIAFHEYKMFQDTAIFIMIIITGFAVALSIAYDRMELAIVSLVGGFAAPFMVNNGSGNYIGLFTYILILDSGMLVLAYFKKWNWVYYISYAFTLILFGSWLVQYFEGDNPRMIVASIIFATLFYLVFFAMNLISTLRKRMSFGEIEISLLLSNTFLYYAAGMFILNNPTGENFRGLFTLLLAIFNFVFAFFLYKKSNVDKKLVFLLIGLVLTFISLAAPVQLKGNNITLFWSAEAVLLLWLSQKSGIRLMKLTSVVIMALMIISLIMDWQQVYFGSDDTYLPIIFNRGYITGMFSLVSISLTIFLLKRETTEKPEQVENYKQILLGVGGVFLYALNFLELRHQLFQYGLGLETQNIILGCYNLFFLSGILFAGRNQKSEDAKGALGFLGAIGIAAYLTYYQSQVVLARNLYLFEDGAFTGFGFHYLLLALVLVAAVLSLRQLQTLTRFNRESFHAYSWFFVFAFVFMASAELDHTVLLISRPAENVYEHILSQNHKIGYPILWGLASFLLIFIGLKTKKKHLRIISLSLFLITLIKLFTVDIRGISEGGKIAAFISLGILLLVVSFMYQRLKKLLLADEPATESPKNPNTL